MRKKKKNPWESDDPDFSYFPKSDNNFVREEPVKEKLTLSTVRDIYMTFKEIDFPVVAQNDIEKVNDIYKLRSNRRSSNDHVQDKLIDKELEKYEISLEVKIQIMIEHMLSTYSKNGCELATINGQPYYNNNYEYEEIDDVLWIGVLADAAEKFSKISFKTPELENALYMKFQSLSFINPTDIDGNIIKMSSSEKITWINKTIRLTPIKY